ncbi:exosortase A [Novosphingobium sp. 9]|uniref:exosortase A n=1 Tax=Novosphingobium sp. 9 TaxID=2025349 RepID=UPI0028CB1C6C|nr:exosortase A [Novosphingobium sp. 9]
MASPDIVMRVRSDLSSDAPAQPDWRAAIQRIGLVWLGLIAVFWPDWLAMVRQWWDISTYNHVLLVPVILGWLVWQRSGQLIHLQPRAWWPGLVPLLLAGFLWLLGAMSGLDIARQAGAVGLLMGSVPLLLGPQVTAGLWFPLCYMVFLVPAGDELVGPLQTITAKITVALTHLSGVPAVIEGVFIDTPAGLFEVAEACSGVKFLIAMFAFGVLAANVCFVSWRRRAAMILACIIVPVLANGVRAWGTVYAAQIFGIKVAAGIDHIIYGWFFFAIVLAVVILCAWRFFDRHPDAGMISVSEIADSPLIGRLRRFEATTWKALFALVLVVVGYQAWAFGADQVRAPLPARIDLPAVPGWQRVNYAPQIWWSPQAEGAEHRLLGRYANAAGQQVDVFIAVYDSQGEGREAGGFGQGALMPSSPWAWQDDVAGLDGGKGEQLLGDGRVQRVAQTWYRTGSLMTGSNLRLKIEVIADHLLLRDRPTSLLILSAEQSRGRDGNAAITAFARSAGPLDLWVDRIAGLR